MVGILPAAETIHDATLDAAIAGDTMAFARIVRAHHDDMARVCQLICGDPDLAQDAAQSAWPLAWRRLRTLRDPDKLRPWLITIAANEARRLVRQQRRDRVVAIWLHRDRRRRQKDRVGRESWKDPSADPTDGARDRWVSRRVRIPGGAVASNDSAASNALGT